eukprot:1432665-Rhodomonas_salina.1
MDTEERRSGLFIAGVEAYRVGGTSRQPYGTVWCHMTRKLGQSALFSICDDAGRLLVHAYGLAGGEMKMPERRSMWVDTWIPSESDSESGTKPPKEGVLRPQSAAELHWAVAARGKTQPQLLVVAKEEAVAVSSNVMIEGRRSQILATVRR